MLRRAAFRIYRDALAAGYHSAETGFRHITGKIEGKPVPENNHFFVLMVIALWFHPNPLHPNCLATKCRIHASPRRMARIYRYLLVGDELFGFRDIDVQLRYPAGIHRRHPPTRERYKMI